MDSNDPIRKLFSEKQLKVLDKLPRTLKVGKYIFLLIIIFLGASAYLYLRLAMSIGARHGINGIVNVLSMFYKGVEPGTTYQAYERVIAETIGNAHLYLGAVILLSVFYFVTRVLQKLLLKCWQLLSSKEKNKNETET